MLESENGESSNLINTKNILKIKQIIADYLLPILIAVIFALLIRQFLFFKIIVPTASMYPTIKDNDQIMVTKVYNRNNLKRGDILDFHSKELKMDLIKRLIGLPNDKVEVTNNGAVYVNGEKLSEPYVVDNGGKSGVYKVPAGHYFFLGDNRIDSRDSRYWNNPYIDGADILGKAQVTIYPFNRFGILK
jgi:signal peptidase I